MDFNDSPEQAEFRKTCRKWLEGNAELNSGASREDSFGSSKHLEAAKQWQKKEICSWLGNVALAKELWGNRSFTN